MRKVLIISYFFNQKEEIGSIRLRGLAKYLSEFGFQPTILTVESDSGYETYFKTVETEYLSIIDNWKSKMGFNTENNAKYQFNTEDKKYKNVFMDYLLNIGAEIVVYPDSQKNWYKPAVEAGSELLENERFDAIISSSSPVTCHLIAHELKKRYKIPWIADLRDLWTQNPYFNYVWIRKLMEKKLELKTLKDANAITTINKYLKKDLERLHKEKIYVIPNGFDPEEKNNGTSLTDRLSMIYAGRLYSGKRDPELLFKALNELKIEQKINLHDFDINFYAFENNDWLLDEIQKYNLESVVKLHKTIPRNNVLKKQRESQLLLLLTWDNPKEIGTTTGKIFEYLAAERPIFSIGSLGGSVKEIIESTGAGVHLSDFDKIKEYIKKYYDEFKLNGKIKYSGNIEEIGKYSHKKMAKKFANILESITKNKN